MSQLVADDDRDPLLVGRGALPGVVQQVRFPVTKKKTMKSWIVLLYTKNFFFLYNYCLACSNVNLYGSLTENEKLNCFLSYRNTFFTQTTVWFLNALVTICILCIGPNVWPFNVCFILLFNDRVLNFKLFTTKIKFALVDSFIKE